MTKELIEQSRQRHAITDIALLIITVALIVSLVIAATVVSIGMARAGTFDAFIENGSVHYALAVFLGFVIAGIGGLAIMIGAGRRTSAAGGNAVKARARAIASDASAAVTSLRRLQSG